MTPEWLTSQDHRPTLGLLVLTFPWRNKLGTCLLIILDHFPHGKGQRSFYWDRHIFWYGFVFLAYNVSATTTIHGLIGCLIHFHYILHNIASDEGTHFTAKEMQQWAHAMKFTGHTLYTPSSRSIWPNRIVGWLTQDSVSLKTISWKNGAILHNATYTLNQRPICDAVFSIASINIGIKSWRWECFFSILYLKICLQNFCFSYHNVKLYWSEDLENPG